MGLSGFLNHARPPSSLPDVLFAKVRAVLEMLQDLVRHKGYANAALLTAIRQQEGAPQDGELRRLLGHILEADRFWLLLCLGRPFVPEKVAETSALEAIAALCRANHAEELEWLTHLREGDLDRAVETSFLPGSRFSVAQALMQVCLHSHAHRAQCATRLRFLGGTPPPTDFILWLGKRPPPDWS
jgi:uncharacterized damage-inducible protein DinB